MAEITSLEGYLMKEKSKTGMLHRLTSDITKRFFKVQKIEASDELALCYFKNKANSQVRGWIYLNDMTEIAENQDTIILTSVARTLYLHAQTRAEHNAWVMGLAKLCPDAFIKLGRNASFVKQANAPSPSIMKEVMRTASASNSHFVNRDIVDPVVRSVRSCGDITDDETVTTERRATRSADEDTNGRSKKEDKRNKSTRNKMESVKRPSPYGWSSDKVGSRQPKSQQRSASWDGDSEALNSLWRPTEHIHDRIGENAEKYYNHYHYQEHRSSNEKATSQLLRAERAERGKSDKWGRCDIQPQSNGRPLGGEGTGVRSGVNFGQEDVSLKMTVNIGGLTKNDDTEYEGEQNIDCGIDKAPGRSSSKDGLDVHGDMENKRRGGRKGIAWHDEQSVDPKSLVPKRIERCLDLESDYCNTKLPRSSFEAPDNQKMSRVGLCTSLGTEHVKTIEPEKLAENRLAHGVITDNDIASKTILVEEGHDLREPDDEQNWSNQDEERELDQGREIDLSAPTVEVLAWEGPRQGKSVTSQLHRHISGVDADAVICDDSLPPPKEFLINHKLEFPPSARQREGDSSETGVHIPGARNSSLGRANTPVKASRRKSAADLEWNHSTKPQQILRPIEEKLAPSVAFGPIDLGESDDDAMDDLNLEVEKHRRRANAAVLALEVAAKEADQGALINSLLDNDLRQRDCNAMEMEIPPKSNRTGPKPPPSDPPLAEAIRTGRPVQGVHAPRLAPPKFPPSFRLRHANRRLESAAFIDDDWDEDDKTSLQSSSMVPVSSAQESLPVQCTPDSMPLLDDVQGQSNH